MRSFATAFVLYCLAGMAGAQCNSSTSLKAVTSLMPELYTVSAQQPAPAVKHAVGRAVVAAAVTGPARPGAAASPVKTDRAGIRFSRSGAAALYAAIAVMAAMVLRRLGR